MSIHKSLDSIATFLAVVMFLGSIVHGAPSGSGSVEKSGEGPIARAAGVPPVPPPAQATEHTVSSEAAASAPNANTTKSSSELGTKSTSNTSATTSGMSSASGESAIAVVPHHDHVADQKANPLSETKAKAEETPSGKEAASKETTGGTSAGAHVTDGGHGASDAGVSGTNGSSSVVLNTFTTFSAIGFVLMASMF